MKIKEDISQIFMEIKDQNNKKQIATQKLRKNFRKSDKIRAE